MQKKVVETQKQLAAAEKDKEALVAKVKLFEKEQKRTRAAASAATTGRT